MAAKKFAHRQALFITEIADSFIFLRPLQYRFDTSVPVNFWYLLLQQGGVLAIETTSRERQLHAYLPCYTRKLNYVELTGV